MPAAARVARASKTKTVNGRTVSAKSKTGDPACSQAMSDWKLNGMTPAVAAVLGRCRAKSRAQNQANQHRAAGNEGKAQRLEAIASGKKGPITAKDRLARAKELKAGLNAKRSAAQAPPQAAPAKAAFAPRNQRKGYRRPDLPEHGRTKDATTAGIRKAAADRIRSERAAGQSGKTAPPAPKPSLREQAAAHRASKGTAAERLARIQDRARTINSGLLGRKGSLDKSTEYQRGQLRDANMMRDTSAQSAATKGINRNAAESDRLRKRNNSLVARVERAKGVAAGAGRPASPAPAPPKPSLRSQADAHKAANGDRQTRLSALRSKIEERASRQGSQSGRARVLAKMDRFASKPSPSLSARPSGDRLAKIKSTLAKHSDRSKAAFASRVHDAAAASTPGERFGDNKVFIGDLHNRMAGSNAGIKAMGVDAFKSKLASANQARHLNMARADLVEGMNPKQVAASQTKHMNAEFHFVRVEPDVAAKARARAGKLAPASPSASSSAAASRVAAIKKKARTGTDLTLEQIGTSKAWVARVKAMRGGVSRDFERGYRDYGGANSVRSRGVTETYSLAPGKVYEINEPRSWKKTDRYFARINRTGLKHMSAPRAARYLDLLKSRNLA